MQFNDPDFRGGANEVSLREAQENYRQTGVSDMRKLANLQRPPAEDEPTN